MPAAWSEPWDAAVPVEPGRGEWRLKAPPGHADLNSGCSRAERLGGKTTLGISDTGQRLNHDRLKSSGMPRPAGCGCVPRSALAEDVGQGTDA